MNNNLRRKTMKNQREAVYQATKSILIENNIPHEDGQDVDGIVSKEMRATIIAIVCSGFQTGDVEMSAEGKIKYEDPKKLKGYVSGLVSNWFRKDTRLNGGEKYSAKNPGSRTGAGDEQLKVLKTLRAAKADDDEAVAAIDAAIEARKLELTPTKSVTLSADQINLIPAELRSKLGI